MNNFSWRFVSVNIIGWYSTNTYWYGSKSCLSPGWSSSPQGQRCLLALWSSPPSYCKGKAWQGPLGYPLRAEAVLDLSGQCSTLLNIFNKKAHFFCLCIYTRSRDKIYLFLWIIIKNWKHCSMKNRNVERNLFQQTASSGKKNKQNKNTLTGLRLRILLLYMYTYS